MQRTEIAILKGPQGRTGLRGFPGASDVPTDPAMAEILAARDSAAFAETAVSLRNTMGRITVGYKMADRLQPAVNRVRTGAGPSKFLCIGDSTTWGTGSDGTFSNAFSWPSEMARDLSQLVAPTVYGLSIPPSDNQPTSDPRWVVGAGWAQATESGVGLGGRKSAYKGVAGGGGTLKFTDGRAAFNRYNIYYTTNASAGAAGTFTAQSGTGTPLVVSTHTPGGSGIGKATVVGFLSSTDGVTIQNTGATGNIWIIGIEPYVEGDSRIQVGNAGVAASGLSGWLQKASGTDSWNVIGFLPVYDPDVTIINLGINDAGGAVPVATYISQLQILADAAYAAGSAVLITTPIPIDGEPRATLLGQYAAAVRSQLSPSYAVLDLHSHYGSWARTNARGWMDDWAHGKNPMYDDVGALVADMLFRYSGHGG